jgi:hypothetical protein
MSVVVEKGPSPHCNVGTIVEIGRCGAKADAIRVVPSEVGSAALRFRTPRWRDFPVGGHVEFSILLPRSLEGGNWHCFRFCGVGTVIEHRKTEGIADSDWRGITVAFETPVRLR